MTGKSPRVVVTMEEGGPGSYLVPRPTGPAAVVPMVRDTSEDLGALMDAERLVSELRRVWLLPYAVPWSRLNRVEVHLIRLQVRLLDGPPALDGPPEPDPRD